MSDLIDVRPTLFGYEVWDGRDEIIAGRGCGNFSPQIAYCGFLVFGVDVLGGGGDDLIGLWDVSLPVHVDGGEGDDFLEGGSGPDSLAGGGGEDGIVAGQGNDVLEGGDDDDVLSGGDDADTITGGDGDDVLEANRGGGNVLLGGPDVDLLRGGPNDDRLNGDSGDDALMSGGGDDVIETGPGNDRVFGPQPGDEVRCTSRDRVRAPRRYKTKCRRLAPSAPAPTVWPPRDSASSAQVPAPDPKVRASVRRPGAAKRTTICIDHPYLVPDVLVKVRTYTRRGRVINRFKRVMSAGTCRTFRSPSPGRRAVHARARLRGSSF